MSKHTEGPWMLSEYAGKLHLWGGKNHDEWIAELHSIPTTAKADAHMLTASLDMYEALSDIIDMAQEYAANYAEWWGERRKDVQADNFARIAKARAALAKAEEEAL